MLNPLQVNLFQLLYFSGPKFLFGSFYHFYLSFDFLICSYTVLISFRSLAVLSISSPSVFKTIKLKSLSRKFGFWAPLAWLC